LRVHYFHPDLSGATAIIIGNVGKIANEKRIQDESDGVLAYKNIAIFVLPLGGAGRLL
jgi:hypothetical protein